MQIRMHVRTCINADPASMQIRTCIKADQDSCFDLPQCRPASMHALPTCINADQDACSDPFQCRLGCMLRPASMQTLHQCRSGSASKQIRMHAPTCLNADLLQCMLCRPASIQIRMHALTRFSADQDACSDLHQ